MATETLQPDKPMEHGRYKWGECFTGTKAQLQSVGIGVGLAFPGEPGGPKRAMTAIHATGLRVRIRRAYAWEGPNRFDVHMAYRDNRQIEAARRRRRTSMFAPGVTLHRGDWNTDVYAGAASTLIAAGLIRMDQLPGQPGRPAKRVTYLATGEQTAKGCSLPHHRVPGYRTVILAGRDRYRVEVRVSEEESARRERAREIQDAADARADASARREFLAETVAQAQAAPQPTPRRQASRAGLRLVWSRPGA